MRYSRKVVNTLWWDEEDAAHIRSRSSRYPGATDIEPDWTLERPLIQHGCYSTRTRRVERLYPVDWLLGSRRVRVERDYRPGRPLRSDGVEDPRD